VRERKRIAIDVLADCAMAGQSPASVATDEQMDLISEADDRFLELVNPAFMAAAERVGVDLEITADGGRIYHVDRQWEDQDALWAAWQAVHDAVEVDIPGLARQALIDVAQRD
jgi:hypothetical protein